MPRGDGDGNNESVCAVMACQRRGKRLCRDGKWGDDRMVGAREKVAGLRLWCAFWEASCRWTIVVKHKSRRRNCDPGVWGGSLI